MEREYLPPPGDLPEGYAWLHSQEIEKAYDASVFISDVQQRYLSWFVKDADGGSGPWAASLDEGSLTLSGNKFKIQLIGTTNPMSWIFGSVRHPSGFAEHLSNEIDRLRQQDEELQGIPEFASDRIGFADILDGDTFGHRMSMIFVRKLRAYGYYRMPSGPGCAAWAAIMGNLDEAQPIPRQLKPDPALTPAQRLNELRIHIQARVSTGPQNPWLWQQDLAHAITSALDYFGITYTVVLNTNESAENGGTASKIVAGSDTDEEMLVIQLDHLGRATSFEFHVSADAQSPVFDRLLEDMGPTG